MFSTLGLLTSLSFTIATVSSQSVYTVWPWPKHSLPPPPAPILVTTTTVDQTWIVTCPAPPTVFINVTQIEYIPVTTTASEFFTDTATISEFFTDTTTTSEFFTDTTTTSEIFTDTTTTSEFFTDTTTTSITIFQTIISTSVVTTTQTVTETTTTPTTLTVTTPITDTVTTPTTATATEIISLYEITTQATSITLCPSRIVNPTYTAAGPYPTDWTWGCPPGWLCKPVLENCNFEAGIPDRNFLCSPNECILAEVIPGILPTWDVDIYGNSTPATNPALRVNAIDNFFNMDPTQFGLTYEIFVVQEVLTRTTTILLPPSPTMAARQAQTSIPGACYPWCNNCLLEAQSNGKTSKLCVPGSAFEVSLGQCEQCIDYHKSDDTASFVEIAPQFQQFLDYCDRFSTIVVSTTVTATTTNAAGSTYSTVTGTISTTVTPKSSAAPSSSDPSSSIVTIATLTPVPSTTITVTSGTLTGTLTSSILSTLSPTSSSSSRPPATSSSSLQPHLTTETVVTTSYSHTTVSGSALSQITILMPGGDNGTTTVYGSDLTSGGASLVLPTSPVTSTYTTTLTISSSGVVSAVATTSGASGATSATSSAASTSTSSFTGASTALKLSGSETHLRTAALGLIICLIAMQWL